MGSQCSPETHDNGVATEFLVPDMNLKYALAPTEGKSVLWVDRVVTPSSSSKKLRCCKTNMGMGQKIISLDFSGQDQPNALLHLWSPHKEPTLRRARTFRTELSSFLGRDLLNPLLQVQKPITSL